MTPGGRLRALAALALALAPGCREAAAPPLPNLVVVLADDLRADVLEPAFQSFAATPALDRLAAEGVRFENAFAVTAACNPSRASLLTGRYTHRSGVSENRVTPARDPLPALALRLQRAGYHTAFLGKYHMDESCLPREGFDRWGCLEGNYGQGDYLDPKLRFRDGTRTLLGHSTDALAELASSWIAELHGSPFFLLLSLKSPHAPMTPTRRHEQLYSDARIALPPSAGDAIATLPLAMQIRPQNDALRALVRRLGQRGDPRVEVRREYARSLADLDDAVAQIDRALGAAGIREQTLLAFTSDHGVLLGEHGLWRKEVAYEESIRIPLLLRHPAALHAGQRRPELVLNVDLPATLLARAEGGSPAEVDGRDLYALAAGAGDPAWRSEFLYLAPYPSGGRPALLALRSARWKYVRHLAAQIEEELFDLELDPGERHNLAGDPERAATLAERRDALGRLLDAQQLPRSWLEAGAGRRRGQQPPHSR